MLMALKMLLKVDMKFMKERNYMEIEIIKKEDGEIILNNKQIKMIEDILRKYITDVHVIKYDKDIDISKIVTNTHLMISDKMGVIYLISYVANGDYPIDNDIESSMLNLLKKQEK